MADFQQPNNSNTTPTPDKGYGSDDNERPSPFNQKTFGDGGNGAPPAQGEYVLPQFVNNYQNNETMRNKPSDSSPLLYGQQFDAGQRDQDEGGLMTRTNTTFNIRNQNYEPLPFEE